MTFKYKHSMKEKRGFDRFYNLAIPQWVERFGEPESILEIGIGGGGGHFMWNKNFPRARVVGIDPLLPEMDNGSQKGGLNGTASAVQFLATRDIGTQARVDFIFADGLNNGVIDRIGEAYGKFDLIVFDATDYDHKNCPYVIPLWQSHLSDTGLLIHELPGIRGWNRRTQELLQDPDPQIGRLQRCVDQGAVVYNFDSISTHIEQEEEYPGHWRDNRIAVLDNAAYQQLDMDDLDQYIWNAEGDKYQ